jgi:two-component system sensor histidine kinase/response regulator
VNLLGNAIRFSPAAGIVKVMVQRAAEADFMQFAVSDTGPGIRRDQFERIFEKFGQVEAAHIGRKASTGLGLTFCKLAVEAHGGRIWVDSEEGHGSTFTFVVPLRP